MDYQDRIISAVVLMRRSGIRMPHSEADWIYSKIPATGKLIGGVPYFKHGQGCRVSLAEGEVDFDFGEHGEIGGFDAWWLYNFAGNHIGDYGFTRLAEINNYLLHLLDEGRLERVGFGLYYLTDKSRIIAAMVDYVLPGEMLPSRYDDKVLVLYSHYFQAAELMRENYGKIEKKEIDKHFLSKKDDVDAGIYLSAWLGFLGVSCEGFRSLNMRFLLTEQRPESFGKLIPLSDGIGRKMKIYTNELRRLRNDIFHLRDGLSAIHDFFGDHKNCIPWAKELHEDLKNFFSHYHVCCEVHYVIHGRVGESEMIREASSHKRKK